MSKVADTSATVTAMGKSWPVIEALMGGTLAMREAGEKLMPRFEMEDPADHKTRISVATLFPAYERTVGVMAAKPFSQPITYGSDVPEQIKTWCENVDLEGVNLDAFAAEMFEESFYGLAGILVDTPKPVTPAGRTATKAEQDAAGVRPYFVRVKHGQFRGWFVETKAGRRVLTMLRICETVTERDGEFGEKTVEQIRFLIPGAWLIYRKSEASTAATEEWVIHDKGTCALPYIPFVPTYGKRLGFMVGKPRLENLAHMNVKHWQSQSDQDDSVKFARKRLLVLAGGDPDKPIVSSANYAVTLPQGATLTVVQGSAESVKVGREELEALEKQMIQAGAELLVKTPGQRSATESAGDQDANKCDLQRMTETFEDSLDQALQIMADYAKLASGGHVTLFKDFGVDSLSEASEQVVLALATQGFIRPETAVNEFKRRGTLSPEVDAAAEARHYESLGPGLGTITDDDTGDEDALPADDKTGA